ncbi:LysR family transcriptional regulator [uncultured Paraglaciecola sp.]|uniref:LysR family transcriptional regulator n=1 Tax=uncultured Paraglaciecola sp. TaxID=1765024 RepID=UPI0030D933BD
MNPPPIQWLAVFAAAAKYSSFRKAADTLHVSPPAVSQQIKALEEYLGSKLFRRNGPRLTLSSAGEFYYQVAANIMSLHHSGFTEFDQRFNKRSLRLSTPLFIAQELLIPHYMAYKELQSKAELRITTGSEYIDFDTGQADAAIRFGHGGWPNLVSRLLCKVHISPVVSPLYQAKCMRQPQSDLSSLVNNHILITTDENLQDWYSLFPDIHPKDVIVCDSYFSAIKSAEKGLGIVLGLFPAINNWVNEGRLTQLSNGYFDTQSAYWLVSPKQQEDNPLIASCFTWAKTLFDGLPALHNE